MSDDPRQLAALAYFEMARRTGRHPGTAAEIWAVEEMFFRTLRPVSQHIPRPRRLFGRRAA